MEQLVGVEAVEILGVPVHRLLERPVEETDIFQRKRPHGNGNLGLDFIHPAFVISSSANERKSNQAGDGNPEC